MNADADIHTASKILKWLNTWSNDKRDVTPSTWLEKIIVAQEFRHLFPWWDFEPVFCALTVISHSSHLPHLQSQKAAVVDWRLRRWANGTPLALTISRSRFVPESFLRIEKNWRILVFFQRLSLWYSFWGSTRNVWQTQVLELFSPLKISSQTELVLFSRSCELIPVRTRD